MDMSSTGTDVREGTLVTKMRKGTHSCSECRRRKVRCIYLAGQDKCRECRFRGSNCIDQSFSNKGTLTQRTKSMRERISELEALVQALLAGKTTDLTNQSRAFIDDVAPPTPISSADSPEFHLSPLIQLFDNAVVSIMQKPRVRAKHGQISQANDQITVDKHPHTDDTSLSVPDEASVLSLGNENLPNEDKSRRVTDPRILKDQQTRKKLLACIDFDEGLDGAFQENGLRWMTWRYRILGSILCEPLAIWGKRVIRNGSPSDLGVLVLFLGTRTDYKSLKRLIPLVADLIISNDDYTTTLSGIECSLLLSDYHARIGQPRRAWLAIQRGLASAQLLGLHYHCSSPMGAGMWSLLCFNNQFLSLILGVPRDVESHCGTDYPEEDLRFFKTKLAVLCNKFLAQTRDRSQQCLASVLEIDQQLQALVLLMPEEWRDVQEEPSGTAQLCASYIHHERILTLIYLQQLRTYLYLPFMLGSTPGRPVPTLMYEMSRIACLQSSRELLKFYHFLAREAVYGNALLDFIGFSAAMLIMLNLLGYHQASDGDHHLSQETERDKQDWQIIDTTMEAIADRAKRHDSKVSRQSLEVLQTLSEVRKPGCIIPPGCSYRFVVPFFGEILAQPGIKFSVTSARNGFISANHTRTSHDSDQSMDESSGNISQYAPNHFAKANARSPKAISEFSGWNMPSIVQQELEQCAHIEAHGLEGTNADNTLNDLQCFGFEPGMERMPYLSDMDLNQDWMWYAEPSMNDQNNGVC